MYRTPSSMNFIVARYPGLPGSGARIANAGEFMGSGGWLGNMTSSAAWLSPGRIFETQAMNATSEASATRIFDHLPEPAEYHGQRQISCRAVRRGQADPSS